MKYLSAEDILHIHFLLIEELGGLHGVRDRNALASAAQTPAQVVFGKELYPTIFDKAVVYARDLIMHHAFLDGNKRTGMTAASVFLGDNGYYVHIPKGVLEEMAIRVVVEKLEVPAIAVWFKKHAKRIKQ